MGLGSGFEWDGQTSVRESGEGAYAAYLADGWRVGGGLNGGYLLSVMGNAVKASVPSKPDPIAVSAHYLSASVPGPAVVETRVLRQCGSLATVAAELRQADDVRITALATYGDLSGFRVRCPRNRLGRWPTSSWARHGR